MTTTALPRRRLPLDVTGQPQATPDRPGTVRTLRRTLRRAVRLRLTDDGERPVFGPVLLLGPTGGPVWTFPVDSGRR
jgi:hypothetical protein